MLPLTEAWQNQRHYGITWYVWAVSTRHKACWAAVDARQRKRAASGVYDQCHSQALSRATGTRTLEYV